MTNSSPKPVTVLEGAIAGIIVWWVYLAAEQFFLSVAPVVLNRDPRLVVWTAVPILAVVYGGIGAILGALGALLIRFARTPRRADARLDPCGTLAAFTLLTIVVADQTIHAEGSIFRWLPSIFFLAIILVFAGVSLNFSWARRLSFVTSAWFISGVLVGSTWVIKDYLRDARPAWRLTGLGILLLVLGSIGFLTKTWRAAGAKNGLLAASAAVIAAWASTLLFYPKPLERAPLAATATPAGNRKNVILIVLDTVRADHLSLHGYARETTPNLRKFAAHATFYQNASSPNDMTLASHASLFTGIYPSWHGAHFTPSHPYGAPLSDNLLTMAEILRGVGYRTVSVAANRGYINPGFGFDQGFEYFDSRAGKLFMGPCPRYLLRDRLRSSVCRLLGRDPDAYTYRSADEITAEALELVKDPGGAGRPLFLFLNLMDAHAPSVPPPPFDHMFPGNVGVETLDERLKAADEISNFKRQPTSQERERWISIYDGAIAHMDAQISRFFDRLRQLRLYDDALIIITSDHGESFGARSMVGHALGVVYQNMVHVPLIIKLPGQQTSSIVQEPVSLIDILPTVLSTLELQRPPGLQGVDLNHPGDWLSRRTLSEAYPTALPTLRKRFTHIERSLTQGSLKLIVSDKGSRELYDLSKDPGESQNLYRADDPRCVEMLGYLNKLLATARTRSTGPGALDSRTRERLRSLGYIQ